MGDERRRLVNSIVHEILKLNLGNIYPRVNYDEGDALSMPTNICLPNEAIYAVVEDTQTSFKQNL